MNISKRLDKLVQTIDKCEVLADIGCDHGYVGIAAIERGRADMVVAADVAVGPLNAAKLNAAVEGVSDRMCFVLSDGFSSIPDASGIECAVIAGMGGILMRDILKEGRLLRFKGLKQLVLSPQSDLDLVRRYIIEEMHWHIAAEYVVYDERKYYFLFDVRIDDCSRDEETLDAAGHADLLKGERQQDGGLGHEHDAYCDTYSEAEYYYGKHIAEESIDTYIEFLHFKQRVSEYARDKAASGSSENGRIKAAELDRQLEYIQTILSHYALNRPAEAGEKEELKRHD